MPATPSPCVEAHDDDAAGGAAVAVDGLDVGAHDLALRGDEEELLVRLGDELDGSHGSGLGALERDEPDALGAAVHGPEVAQRHALAVAGLGQHEDVAVGLDHAHAHDAVALARQADADDAGRVAAHGPDLALVEAGEAALRRGQDDVVLSRRDGHPGEGVVGPDREGPDAGGAHALEALDGRLLDEALHRGHDEVVAGLEVGQRDDRQDPLAGLHLDALEVDDGHALGLSGGVGNGVDLGAEDAPTIGEEERPVVRVGDEQVRHGILLDRARPDDALAAARLAPVGDEGLALDVAATRDGHHDVLVGDEVVVGELLVGAALDARATVLPVARVQLPELVADDLEDAPRVGQDVLELRDARDDRDVLVLDLLALERRQATQLHLEDGVGLDLGEPEAADEVGARGLHVRRLADGRDHGVEVVERGLEALEDVGAVTGLLEVELGAPAHDLATPVDVVLEERLERQGLGLAVDEGHDVGVEGHLQRRVLEEVVEHLAGRRVLLALDDDAHAVAVRLVAHVGDALDLAALHEVGDLLEQGRLVDLVGDGRGDDGGAAGTGLLERHLGLHDDSAAPVGVHVADGVDLLPLAGDRVAAPVVAEDRAAGGQVGAEQVLGRAGPW